MPPVPVRIEGYALHTVLCVCCRHVRMAEKSGLTKEDVGAIKEQIILLINNFASSQVLSALKVQIKNTLGVLEKDQPNGWEEDCCFLYCFLDIVSEAAYCGDCD